MPRCGEDRLGWAKKPPFSSRNGGFWLPTSSTRPGSEAGPRRWSAGARVDPPAVVNHARLSRASKPARLSRRCRGVAKRTVDRVARKSTCTCRGRRGTNASVTFYGVQEQPGLAVKEAGVRPTLAPTNGIFLARRRAEGSQPSPAPIPVGSPGPGQRPSPLRTALAGAGPRGASCASSLTHPEVRTLDQPPGS